MTDYKLNLAIMTALGLAPIERWNTSHDNGITTSECTFKADPTDYCNSWNDLMPLVVEHEITLYEPNQAGTWPNWNAVKFFPALGVEDIQVLNESPQRALAECLLKVLTNKS